MRTSKLLSLFSLAAGAWTVALLVGLILPAQTPPPAGAAASDKKMIRMEGRVLSTTGDAVRRATVRLQGNPQPGVIIQNPQQLSNYSETTDDAGKFVFEDVAPGRYTMTAEKTGFVTQRYGARSDTSPGTPLVVDSGDSVKDLLVKMTPQAILVGRVIDQDGDPVVGVQVSVMRYGYSNGRRQLMPGGGPGVGGRGGPGAGPGAGVTDDQGNFRIANLSPGRYYLNADPRGNGNGPILIGGPQERPGRAAAPQTQNVATFFPNALDVSAAAPVEVPSGGEIRGIEIRMRKERVFSVRGKAMDTVLGGPAAGAYILIAPPEGAGIGPLQLNNMVRANPDGSFEIRNLLPGTHQLLGSAGSTLTISSAGGGGLAMIRTQAANTAETGATGRMEVSVTDSDVNNVVLQLNGGSDINGTIKSEDGDIKDWLQPPPQPQNQGGPAGLPPLMGGPKSVRLAPTEGTSVSAPSAQFDEKGNFVLKNVAGAKYFFAMGSLPPGTYIKTVRFGRQDVTRSPLDLSAGGGGSIDIVLSAKAADVSGAVRNEKGEPVQGLPVTLWPKIPDRSSANGGVKTANTDQNGGFKISGLAPGDYYVAAWDDVPEAGLSQNPDFLARFNNDDYAVKLDPSGHQSADVKLVPREKILAEAAKLP